MKDKRPVSRYVPRKDREFARDVARQNARNMALARSPLALSFIPSRPGTSRPQTSRPDTSSGQQEENKDFYQTFLESQVDELQERVDELDLEFAGLNRQCIDLSTQVKSMEGDAAALIDGLRNSAVESNEHSKLTEVVQSTNEKLSTARSQLTQALAAKSERLKRLESYRKELEERSVLLSQHNSRPINERESQGERKLKSALQKK